MEMINNKFIVKKENVISWFKILAEKNQRTEIPGRKDKKKLILPLKKPIVLQYLN